MTREGLSTPRWRRNRAGGHRLSGASGAHRLRQLGEQSAGFVPADAGVGDALAVDQFAAGDELLRSGDQIAFKHHADDAAIAGGDLRGDIAADGGLAGVVLAAVGVAAVDHDARRQAGLLEQPAGFVDRGGIVVRRSRGRRAG